MISRSTHSFPDRFTNLSKINLKNKFVHLLERGHKYCPSPHNINTHTLAVDLEVQLTRHNKYNTVIKGELSQKLSNIKFTQQNNEQVPGPSREQHKKLYADRDILTIKQFNKFIKNNDLTITKGDKNAGLVILETEEYINKTEAFFINNNITKLNNNPTKLYASKMSKCLTQYTSTLKKANISSFLSKVMNPHCPQLKSLIKLHKADKSIRPIITNYNTPASKIARLLQTFVVRDLQFKAKHTVRNSSELITSIQDYIPNNKTTILSFDITNLYNNIPVAKSLRIVSEFLSDELLGKGDFDIIDIENIMDIFETVTKQNFFSFNNKYYQMKDGVQMGSPLSGLIADMFVDKLEKELFSDKHKMFTNNIKYYCRYVDDIFIIHEGPRVNIKAIHNILNSLSNLQFTIEIEKEQQLNFLDLTIKKDIKNKSLLFQIFRKPTSTDIIIPSSSHSPPEHKEAAFRFLFNRATSVPMSTAAYNHEIRTIFAIGNSNGYNDNFIKKIHNKIKLKKNITAIYPHIKTKTKFISIPYNPTYNRQLKPILKKHDLQLAYKSSNNLCNYLSNNKQKVTYLEKSGVYKLTCGNCDKIYIGQCGRSLMERYKEHANTNRSSMSAHLIENNHKISLTNMSLLHNVNKSRKLNLLEEMEIMRYLKSEKENVLNELTYGSSSHLFSELI